MVAVIDLGEIQSLIVHPWVEAAVAGVLLALGGAFIFISVSLLLDALAEERRRRECLMRCGLFGEQKAPAEAPDEAVDLETEGTRALRL